MAPLAIYRGYGARGITGASIASRSSTLARQIRSAIRALARAAETARTIFSLVQCVDGFEQVI